MVMAPGQDASWMSPWGGFSGTPIRGKTLGKTKGTLERLYLLAGLGTFGIPSEELGEVAGERRIWISLVRLLPLQPRLG